MRIPAAWVRVAAPADEDPAERGPGAEGSAVDEDDDEEDRGQNKNDPRPSSDPSASGLAKTKAETQNMQNVEQTNATIMDLLGEYPPPPYTEYPQNAECDAPSDRTVRTAIATRDVQKYNMRDMLRRFVVIATPCDASLHVELVQVYRTAAPRIPPPRRCVTRGVEWVTAATSLQDTSKLTWVFRFRAAPTWDVHLELEAMHFWTGRAAYGARSRELLSALPVDSPIVRVARPLPPLSPPRPGEGEGARLDLATVPLCGTWRHVTEEMRSRERGVYHMLPESLTMRFEQAWTGLQVTDVDLYVPSVDERAAYAATLTRAARATAANGYFSRALGLFPLPYDAESALLAEASPSTSGHFRILPSPAGRAEVLVVRACAPLGESARLGDALPLMRLHLAPTQVELPNCFNFRGRLARFASQQHLGEVGAPTKRWGDAWDFEQLKILFESYSPCVRMEGTYAIRFTGAISMKRYKPGFVLCRLADLSVEGLVRHLNGCPAHELMSRCIDSAGLPVTKKPVQIYLSPIDAARDQRMNQGIDGCCLLCVYMPENVICFDCENKLTRQERDVLIPAWVAAVSSIEPNVREPIAQELFGDMIPKIRKRNREGDQNAGAGRRPRNAGAGRRPRNAGAGRGQS